MTPPIVNENLNDLPESFEEEDVVNEEEEVREDNDFWRALRTMVIETMINSQP